MGLTVSYSPHQNLPEGERLHATFNYELPSWRLFGSYNGADFYDLFGPTRRSRKGHSVGLGYNSNLYKNVYKTLDLDMISAYYGGMERLPEFQNIITAFEQFLSFSGRLTYQSMLFSLGAVDYEKGMQWEFMSSNNFVEGTSFPRINQNLDFGFALPLRHSSIWVRSSAGFSFSPRREPLGNFYFGGFGNNRIDYQSSRRYRMFYSFPGTELNEVGGPISANSC